MNLLADTHWIKLNESKQVNKSVKRFMRKQVDPPYQHNATRRRLLVSSWSNWPFGLLCHSTSHLTWSMSEPVRSVTLFCEVKHGDKGLQEIMWLIDLYTYKIWLKPVWLSMFVSLCGVWLVWRCWAINEVMRFLRYWQRACSELHTTM